MEVERRKTHVFSIFHTVCTGVDNYYKYKKAISQNKTNGGNYNNQKDKEDDENE
jgi:hypothetical protein